MRTWEEHCYKQTWEEHCYKRTWEEHCKRKALLQENLGGALQDSMGEALLQVNMG